jgi:1,4-alpha-glucan branching enzyme
MNIYEVHLGSWKRHEGEDGFYTYRELAKELVPYVKEMGYTHVEILPVMEHPLDASWGYQVPGYYAPTARHGEAKDFKYLVDEFHRAGIGVILDWVPGHFCPDDQGLRDFNGGMLYECEIHPDWGTYKFDFGRPQVRSFLYSNAMYWFDEYHADGIRVDGVSSMLYLNFGVSDRSKMKFNKYGDEGNLEAMDFLKELNYMVGTQLPGRITIAEESTAWPMITWPPEKGGLGFHYKWSMGWMHDTLDYMACDFPWRSDNHNKLTFSMTYAYSENYILPLSHDEVVHGKRSLIGRMPGDIWRQFAGIRLLAMYQMTHPGKKLNFMGYEIGQFIEWREYEGLEWFLLEYDNHAKYQTFIKTLNALYKEHPSLWENDTNWEGFQWIDPDNRNQNTLSYLRRSPGKDGELLICVLNMGVEAFDEYEIGVPEPGYYKEIINSDDVKFAGSGRVNTRQIRAKKKPMHGMPYSIKIKMPVVGGTIFEKKK